MKQKQNRQIKIKIKRQAIIWLVFFVFGRYSLSYSFHIFSIKIRSIIYKSFIVKVLVNFLHSLNLIRLKFFKIFRNIFSFIKIKAISKSKFSNKQDINYLIKENTNISFGLKFITGIFAISFIFFASASSKYLTIPFSEAEVIAQNFTQSASLVREGITFLKYEIRSEDDIDSRVELESGSITFDNFVIGKDDLLAYDASNDYLELGYYGDNLPNTQVSDWWDDDSDVATKYNWSYRKCFEIDNSNINSSDLSEYQVYLDLDTATLISAGKMQSDGDDIRFLDSNFNLLDYFIADDINTSSTRIWLKINNISQLTTEDICMYYGNTAAISTASREDVFTYSSPQDIYYVVADSAEEGLTEFSSYIDNNQVNFSTYNNTLNQYEQDTFPSGAIPDLEQITAISTTDPISGGYNMNGADNLVPASFASENFVYRMDRYTNYFSFISPWCDADVEVRNENDNLVTNGSFTITQGSYHNLTTSNNATSGIANDSAVIIETTNGCPILAQHHGSTGGDSFIMAPASTEWYGVGSGHFGFAALYDNTNITVYKSDNTSTTYNLDRGENVDINDVGSEGSDPAHRVVADNLIGVSALADSDGGEAVTFLPVDQMGYKYYFPEDIQYIAIATRENITTTVDLYNDGTQCGVGTPDDTITITATATYPGKIYFGSTTDGVNIPAGACVIADNPIYAYYEYAGENDEHNVWNERQNRQFIASSPTYSVGTVENGSWNIENSDNWLRRIPITVNNTTSTNLTDYQILVDLGVDVSQIFGATQNDGGDLRIAGNLGDGTDNIIYNLEDFDGANSIGKMWIKVPSIPASSNAVIYLYYYPGTINQMQTCSQAEFNNGSYTDTQWDGTNNWTELDSTGLTNGRGQYTSEIFDAGSNSIWSNLNWESNRPTWKELPNNGGVETVYGEGNIDMTGNVLLFHLNETNGSIIDESGEGNDGIYNGVNYSENGIFNQALGFDGFNDEIIVADDNSLDFTTEVSVSAWVYLNSISGWQSFFHKNTDTANHREVYFKQNNGTLYNYDTIQTSSPVLTANEWYHIVYTADASREKMYVNGVLVADEPVEFGGMSNNNDLYIGGSGGGGEQVDGLMDEVSMWNRALTDVEIEDMYRRGSNRLQFQVRSCDDSACVGENFIGPDGTTATYYTEQSNSTLNFPDLTLQNVNDNQYFQYQTIFETDQNSNTPELTCITVDYITRSTGFSTTGNYQSIFHTTTQKANYYIVDQRVVGEKLSVISFADGNNVDDGNINSIVNEGGIKLLPAGSGVSQSDIYSVTGPLQISFNSDTTDSALPISYAGKEFVYNIGRSNDVFSFYAPFADATIQIQESSGTGWTTLQTITATLGNAITVNQDITNGRAFKIIADENILAFHRNSTSDSKILYPTHLALEQDSNHYELYGVGSGSLRLASSSDANITLYRSNGTSANISLNSSNNFVYSESGSGAQGTAYAYHIVSDVPIGASSYADADGGETVVFLSQKEFSREYVVSNPTQYMAIVARDSNVTCRVYDETGTEITSGSMDNIPPQTGGTQTDPYPNNIHIGGDDTSDGAYFSAGYHLTCDEPVYAYYEHHLNSTITDETSWLTWPQVRQRANYEPIVENINSVDEESLYFSSGFDSNGAGTDPEAYVDYIFSTNSLINGEHTYWRDIVWQEVINSKSAENNVDQLTVAIASATPTTTCASATYGLFTTPTVENISTSVDSSISYVDYTTNENRIMIDDIHSDKSCLKVRIYLRTGNLAYSPQFQGMTVGYYVPTELEDQLNNPDINIVGATSGQTERYRALKVLTNDPNLNTSEAFATYRGSSDETVFTEANLDFLEINGQVINSQFNFPPFPASTPTDSSARSDFDANHSMAVYFDNQRTSGSNETLDFTYNVDVMISGGVQISSDFQLIVDGL
jgi:hypothetical protein